jgi:hypothetical protein
VVELRQWVNQYNANPFPGETLPPALSTAQLLDRDRSHTSKCAVVEQHWQIFNACG